MNQTFQAEPQNPLPNGSSSATKIVLIVLVIACVGMLLICGVLAALLFPAVAAARTAAQRQMGANNLEQIGLAMLNYESAYKSIPAVYGINASDEPTGNWRISVSPFLEGVDVLERFDFSKSWDSAVNQELANSMPQVFRSPQADGSQPADQTNVFTIQDPNSAMPSGGSYRKFTEMPDGLPNILVAIVLPEYSKHWLEPNDLTIAEALQHIRAAEHPEFIQLLMMNGAIIPLGDISDEDFADMVTINDGKVVNFR